MADEHGLGSQTASEEARASGDAGSVERDPAGLLQRVPELLPLAGRSPQLKRAIEEGRPHAAYRALIWLKLRGAGTDGPLVNTLLARRRLFLQPLKGAPWMVTYNGVGASVYGATELDPQDRTSVKTHYLVFVFLPFFPLGAYLTRPAEQGKGWTFFGKVPLSLPLYLWQRGVALIVLLLVLRRGAERRRGGTLQHGARRQRLSLPRPGEDRQRRSGRDGGQRGQGAGVGGHATDRGSTRRLRHRSR